MNGHQFNALATGHAESVVDEFGDPNENKIPVTLVYGMDDPSVTFPQSTDLFQSTYDDYTEKFEARFDADFSFGAVEQAKIVADCDAFKADADITDGAEAYCLLNDLKAEVGAAFPYADEAALRAALASFYTSARFAEASASPHTCTLAPLPTCTSTTTTTTASSKPPPPPPPPTPCLLYHRL